MEARVIFSPHISGNPQDFAVFRQQVLDHLIAEAQAGGLNFNPLTKHLKRSKGACVFCTMLEIGPCGDGQISYLNELEPITMSGGLTADAPISDLLEEKKQQNILLENFLLQKKSVQNVWETTDEE